MPSKIFIGNGERRRCSVRLALEHDVTGKVTPSDVVTFLHREGECEEGAIKCVQTDKGGSVIVTFESPGYVEQILKFGTITINGFPVVVTSVDARRKYVKVYYLPYEVHNRDLVGELSEYGHVYNVRRDTMVNYPEIETGVRTVTMALDNHIPSFLNVVGFQTKVFRYKTWCFNPLCNYQPDFRVKRLD